MNRARARPIEAGDLGNVGPADKGTAAGAGENGQPQLGIGGDAGRLVDDLLHQRGVEAVALVAIVDRQPRDPAALGRFVVFDQKTI